MKKYNRAIALRYWGYGYLHHWEKVPPVLKVILITLFSFILASNFARCQTDSGVMLPYSNEVAVDLPDSFYERVGIELPLLYNRIFDVEEGMLPCTIPITRDTLKGQYFTILKCLPHLEEFIARDGRNLQLYELGSMRYPLDPELTSVVVLLHHYSSSISVDVLLSINILDGIVTSIHELSSFSLDSDLFTSKSVRGNFLQSDFRVNTHFSFMCGLDTPIDDEFTLLITKGGLIEVRK